MPGENVAPMPFSHQAFIDATGKLGKDQEMLCKEDGSGLATSCFDRFWVRFCNFIFFRSKTEIIEQKIAVWDKFVNALATEESEPGSSKRKYDEKLIDDVLNPYLSRGGNYNKPLTKRCVVSINADLRIERVNRINRANLEASSKVLSALAVENAKKEALKKTLADSLGASGEKYG